MDRHFLLILQFLPTIFYTKSSVASTMKGSQKWETARLQPRIHLHHLQKTAIKLSA